MPGRHRQIPPALCQKIPAPIIGGKEMKTPREILLGKHQPAMPALDAIRQKAVGQLNTEEQKAPSPRPSPIGWERAAVGQPLIYVGRKPLGRFLVLAIQMWTELILP